MALAVTDGALRERIERQVKVLRYLATFVLWTGIVAALAGVVISTNASPRLDEAIEARAMSDDVFLWVGLGTAIVCWLLWAIARGVALQLEVLADRTTR